MTTFGVLGPLQAATAAGPADLKGPRQRAVLARLLIAGGRTVPVDTLVGDLWADPPAGAVPALQTFVSDLRRALEPDRAPRQPARLLVTTPPGYALRVAPQDVDAGRFAAAVTAAQSLESLDEALGLWRGPAYADCADQGWARAEIDRLDELRMLAVERRAEALLTLGRAAEAASGLREHVAAHPLREDAWQLLATALYRAGRQGDALAALRKARATLVAELGVDPGPRLRRLEADVLAQAPSLDVRRPVADERPFVGRDDELARLEAAAAIVARGRRPGFALVSGDPGAGKTALAGALSRRLSGQGWAVAAPEQGSGVFEAADPAVARFQARRAAVARVAALAGPGPLLLVADDLHRAGESTYDLLAALDAEDLPVLVLVTYRATESTPALTAALARIARTEPVRVPLGGLSEAATAEVVRAVTGGTDAAGLIHRRSGGNPFFVRELARLLAAEGAAALDRIPPGVRDVIRHRLDGLPEATRTVLRQAAVIGPDLDQELLRAVAGVDVLDALDQGQRAGFLTDHGFTHLLVRDTLYDDLSAARRSAWHAATGEALERLDPDAAAALAHHFGRAGTRATASRAAGYARVAAAHAERRFELREAARLWHQALGATDVRDRLDAVIGLGRALAVTDHLDASRRYRAEAMTTAARLADPDLTATVIAAFDVPAIWTRNDDEELSARIVAAAEGALAGAGPARRSRLLSTIALELRGDTTGRGDAAAREAEALADDPAVLAFALNARFLHSFGSTGQAAERARIGTALTTLAAAHDLVTFEVLGRLILLQSHSARGDFAAADAESAAVSTLADRYDLPLVAVFTQWYAALRLAAAGRTADARAAYLTAGERLAGSGMPGMADGLLPLALLSLGDPVRTGFGPYEPWARPVVLLAAGRRDEAARVLRAQPGSPHDALREARLTLTARAALALDDQDTIARVRGLLAPATAELAGAASGAVTFGSIRDLLRDLEK